MEMTYSSSSSTQLLLSPEASSPRGLLDAVRRDATQYTLLAWTILALGLVGILLPLLFVSGHPVSYLRSAEHGAGSTTTQSSGIAVQPEHLYRNQAQPRSDTSDPQLTRPIPESGDPIGAAP